MNFRTSASLLLILCLVVGSVPGEAADRLDEAPQTNYMLFDMMFREAASESDHELFTTMHVFAPMYANGFWVRPYFFGIGTYMLVKTTSSDPMGQVCAIEIISDGTEDSFYKELCAFSAAGLSLYYPDDFSSMLTSDFDMETVINATGLDEAGYAFVRKDNALVPYTVIETTRSYEVTDYVDIPTNRSAKYPLPDNTIDLGVFMERFNLIASNSYGMPKDTLKYMDSSEEDSGEWLQILFSDDMMIAVCAVSDHGSMNSAVREMYLLDFADNPSMIVAGGMIAFGAMVDFNAEQMAELSLLAGAHTTFDDFLSFLPVVVAKDMMLLYGISNDSAAAYIMGIP